MNATALATTLLTVRILVALTTSVADELEGRTLPAEVAEEGSGGWRGGDGKGGTNGSERRMSERGSGRTRFARGRGWKLEPGRRRAPRG